MHAARAHLFLHHQAVDTTTPGGKAMLQMLEVFAEFKAGAPTKSGKPIGRLGFSARFEAGFGNRSGLVRVSTTGQTTEKAGTNQLAFWYA